METATIQKAMEYKKAHLNLIQYALNQNCLIDVECRQDNEYNLKKSNNYDEIKKFLHDYDSDFNLHFYKENIYDNLNFYKEIVYKGWAYIIPYNDDEDSVSDYSSNKFLDAWANQFEKLTSDLNN